MTFDGPLKCTVMVAASLDTGITRDNMRTFVDMFNNTFASTFTFLELTGRSHSSSPCRIR